MACASAAAAACARPDRPRSDERKGPLDDHRIRRLPPAARSEALGHLPGESRRPSGRVLPGRALLPESSLGRRRDRLGGHERSVRRRGGLPRRHPQDAPAVQARTRRRARAAQRRARAVPDRRVRGVGGLHGRPDARSPEVGSARMGARRTLHPPVPGRVRSRAEVREQGICADVPHRGGGSVERRHRGRGAVRPLRHREPRGARGELRERERGVPGSRTTLRRHVFGPHGGSGKAHGARRRPRGVRYVGGGAGLARRLYRVARRDQRVGVLRYRQPARPLLDRTRRAQARVPASGNRR